MTGEKNPMYGCCGELNPFYGKKHTDDSKDKISNKAKERYRNRKNHPNSKAIIMLDKYNNEIFFNSIKDCSEWLLNNKIIKSIRTGDDAISKRLKNKKQYKGFTFKYADEDYLEKIS